MAAPSQSVYVNRLPSVAGETQSVAIETQAERSMVCRQTHTHTKTHTQTHTHTHTCTHMYTHKNKQTHTHTHKNKPTNKQTHTHTHTPVRRPLSYSFFLSLSLSPLHSLMYAE